ncbi:MAG: glutamate 5-kinase [Nitrospirota bacterium]|jgi:glutamate 5-kinase
MDRRQLFADARRVVIKVGSRVLTANGDGLDLARITAIAAEIAVLRRERRECLLVSSGAIAAGAKRLGISGRPKSLAESQAAAAVGQGTLIAAYDAAFRQHTLTTAQVLLTHDDTHSRQRFVNARATFEALLQRGVVPIVNENDTVSTAEIRLGDNDHLSAQVAHLVDADLLVLLTDIDGLFTADPNLDPDATRIDEVTQIDGPLLDLAGGSYSTVGSGGMRSKVLTARQAGRYGIATLILNGHRDGQLGHAFQGDPIGTLFWPESHALSSRKHWIAYSLTPAGRVLLDDGACRALRDRGGSLLPSGIIEVQGEFPAGSSISCCDRHGEEFARGLTNFPSDELVKIRGLHTRDIAATLGYESFDEVIHRDNLVLL